MPTRHAASSIAFWPVSLAVSTASWRCASWRSSDGGNMTRLLVLLLLFAPATVEELVTATAESGRVVGMVDSPSDRLAAPVLLSPGAPPVLSFRYFDASDRGRYGDIGLVAD